MEGKVYRHDFLAICPEGHKRNFIWIGPETPLKQVKDQCSRCDKTVIFTIDQYWNEITEDI